MNKTVTSSVLVCVTPHAGLTYIQTRATADEKLIWGQNGCELKDGVWVGPNGEPCLPKHLFPHYAKCTHGKDHVSKGGMMADISIHWYTKGFTMYKKNHCQACVIFATNNIGRGV